MNRSALLLGISVAASTLALLGERDARACGGCFHPPTQTASDITDERMLLSVSPTQTTLYDQIEYAGSPSSFAWVLPIHGTVTVGLSADVLFDSMDTLTATQIVAPNVTCPGPPSDCEGPQAPSAGGATLAAAEDGGVASGVTVTKQQNVRAEPHVDRPVNRQHPREGGRVPRVFNLVVEGRLRRGDREQHPLVGDVGSDLRGGMKAPTACGGVAFARKSER